MKRNRQLNQPLKMPPATPERRSLAPRVFENLMGLEEAASVKK
jgi:hypothetical protein